MEAGQALVELEPPRAAILDPRTRAEADSRVEAARASLNRAEVEAEQARAELDAAVAARRSSDATPSFPVEEVLRAPVAGRVLAVHAESGGHVQPGAPLVEVGETERLRSVSRSWRTSSPATPYGSGRVRPSRARPSSSTAGTTWRTA